jgi:hypothetical protein
MLDQRVEQYLCRSGEAARDADRGQPSAAPGAGVTALTVGGRGSGSPLAIDFVHAFTNG